jgi:hypothetical protein
VFGFIDGQLLIAADVDTLVPDQIGRQPYAADRVRVVNCADEVGEGRKQRQKDIQVDAGRR